MKMSSYFSGRGGSDSFAKDILKEKRSSRSNNGGSGYMDANASLEDLAEQKEDILSKAASVIATYGSTANKNGESNPKTINGELDKLLRNFNAEEQADILKHAVALLIVNL